MSAGTEYPRSPGGGDKKVRVCRWCNKTLTTPEGAKVYPDTTEPAHCETSPNCNWGTVCQDERLKGFGGK